MLLGYKSKLKRLRKIKVNLLNVVKETKNEIKIFK